MTANAINLIQSQSKAASTSFSAPDVSIALSAQQTTVASITIEDTDESHHVEYPSKAQFKLISICVCLCVFLVGLDTTILTTAIPRITDDFGSVQDVGWYDAAFRLASCMSQLSQGKLSENYRLKSIFFINVVVFEIGILISGFASSSTMFIIGRAVAGLGFSGIGQGCMVIIALSIPLRQRAAYIGLISASEFLAIAVAPILGGAITSSLSWRWGFFINVPAAAAPTIVMAFLQLPNMPSFSRKHSPLKKLRELDILGFLALAPAVLCLLLALQWGGTTYSWHNPRIIVLLVLSLIVFAVFLIIQFRKQDRAMLPPRILRKRAMLAGSLFSLCLAATQSIVQFHLPIWFQTVRAASPLQSGINTLPLVGAILVFAVFSGWVISTMGSYTPLMIPTGLCIVSGVSIMITFTPTTPPSLWIPALILFGVGSGTGISTPFIAAQTVLDTKDVSVGMAIMSFSQDIGEAVFISVPQNIFLGRLISNIAHSAPGLNPSDIIHVGATNLEGKLPSKHLAGVISAYSSAIQGTFYVAVALAALMVIAALLIKKNMTKFHRELL